MTEWKDFVRTASTEWLFRQVKTSQTLIHESEQLLRGTRAETCAHLRSALQRERADLQVMTEELDRRKADLP